MFCSLVRIEPLSLGSNLALRCAFWIPRSIAAPLSSRCVTIDHPGPSCRHILRSCRSTVTLLSCAELPAILATDLSVSRIISIERISNHSRSRVGAVPTFWTLAEWTCAIRRHGVGGDAERFFIVKFGRLHRRRGIGYRHLVGRVARSQERAE